MMKTHVFLIYILSLSLGLSYFHSKLKEHFSSSDHLEVRIERLNQSLEEERFKHLLTSYEFMDFRQHVATLLPQAIQEVPSQEQNYPLRVLASVVQQPRQEGFLEMRAQNKFEEGRRLFRNDNFSAAARAFESLIREHSYSGHVPEAMFLLGESYFRMERYSEFLRVTGQMVSLYPDLELTGYALLRSGRVYELQTRYDEAINVYKKLLTVFPNRDIASHARQALHAVEL